MSQKWIVLLRVLYLLVVDLNTYTFKARSVHRPSDAARCFLCLYNSAHQDAGTAVECNSTKETLFSFNFRNLDMLQERFILSLYEIFFSNLHNLIDFHHSVLIINICSTFAHEKRNSSLFLLIPKK